jgi:bacillithiol biosynthesis cysteine-adding enzyme BshC
VTQKTAHKKSDGNAVLRVESLPYSEIPASSRLFIDYQNDPVSLRHFYPAAVADHTRIAERVGVALENHVTDRAILCDALSRFNQRISAGESTYRNIDLLRDADSVAVITGQQAGLFSGPLYTVYKALSAVKMAECLRGRGIRAAPVFWVASEDHDFDEVADTFVIDPGDELVKISSSPAHVADQPVGLIGLDDSISSTIDSLFDSLPHTEFTEEVRDLIANSWQPGNSFSDSFARLMARMFKEHGLVFVDPLDAALKKLASPLYALAAQRSAEIGRSLIDRGMELEKAGYHAQVKVDASYFPLFWHGDEGRRQALKFTTRGTLVTKDRSREFSVSEIQAIAEDRPQHLSPSVVLRPVVQDFLFPSICYFGGSAEVAYFAQNSEVYRVLDRPATTILHRQSFTLIEPRPRRIMDSLGLKFRDLFEGGEKLMMRAAKEKLSKDSARLFADAEEKINTELNRLDQHIAPADPTVAANLATRRRKIIYHIGAIRQKFYRSQAATDATLNRRVHSLLTHLLPKDQLQERSLNVTYFLDRYGDNFGKWIYESIDLSDRGHRIIHL